MKNLVKWIGFVAICLVLLLVGGQLTNVLGRGVLWLLLPVLAILVFISVRRKSFIVR